MQYRRLGKSGLKLSEISLGSWLTYGTRIAMENARACIRQAYDLGVNHFDCAVAYGNRPHEAEAILGPILREFPRTSYTVTSKLFWQIGPATYDGGLSRKHLLERVDISLKSMGLDYIDIYYCHRYDPNTDLEETLRALDDLVSAGKILYYGVSDWTAAQIEDMARIAEHRHLHWPVVDQPGYNMLRRGIEDDVMAACSHHGMGIIAYSPIAQGLLSGKYKPGEPVPEGVRGHAAKGEGRFLVGQLSDRELLERVQRIATLAAEHGLTPSQLALAWVLRRPEVTSALIGATRPEQIAENVKASGVTLSPEVLHRIDEILEA